MKYIRRDFFNASRADEWNLVVISDIHLGAAACDEKRLEAKIARIAADPRALWLDLGDSLDAVNVSDKRFDVEVLSDWIRRDDLKDLAEVESQRYIDLFTPIAAKCIGKGRGNHEDTLRKHYENDVHTRMVQAIKKAAKLRGADKLDLDYACWLDLYFHRGRTVKEGTQRVLLYTHHGMSETRLKPWLWTHQCDLALFGHIHKTKWESVSVEGVNLAGQETIAMRYGAFCGSYLRSNAPGDKPATYNIKKGMIPAAPGAIEIRIRPYATDPDDRLSLTNGSFWTAPQVEDKAA